MHIPVFQKIDELHHATVTSHTAVLQDFHIYRNEDANETCVSNMEATVVIFSRYLLIKNQITQYGTTLKKYRQLITLFILLALVN